jgi:tetratricopeptide (TPR) repeat protein
VSGKVASPLLRDVLSDPSDDVRLLAYGMLDSQEKAINNDIHTERQRLAAATSEAARRGVARRLSGLYWELVYQDLAQGALRTHALEQSLDYTQQSLALDENDAAMHLRRGRLLQLLGQPVVAKQSYEEALRLGLPKTRIIPYLAELAFDLRDFDKTRHCMDDLSVWQSLPRLKPVIDYWRKRPA